MASWSLSYLLPGLYVAVAGALLVAALRRWWDPVPLPVVGIFALVLVLLFAPVLFGGKVLLPLDILPRLGPYQGLEGVSPRGNWLQWDLILQMAPWQAQVRRAYAAGEWPLWNPLVAGGMPLLANPQAQHAQPLVLATLPLPLEEAVGATAALRVLVALVFFFLLLRRQGIGQEAALAGSLAYGLSGMLLLWLGWPIANGVALLPGLLYAVVMVAERRRRRDELLLALFTAAVLTAGHLETSLYALLTAGVFAASRLWSLPADHRLRTLGRWALATALGAALIAPFLLPLLHYLPQTERNMYMEARSRQLAQGGEAAWDQLLRKAETDAAGIEARLTPILGPNAQGNSRFGAYWGPANTNEDATGFAGTATLLAALLAFAPLGRGKRFAEERPVMVLAGVSLVAIARPAFFVRLVEHLPLFDRSASFHHRLLLVLVFAVAYLGAATWERWQRGEGRSPALILAVALALGLGVAWAYAAHPHPSAPGTMAALRTASLTAQLSALAVAAVLFIAVRRPARKRWAMAAMAVLVAGELFVFHAPANPPMPRRLYFPTTPAIAFLQEHLSGDRMIAEQRVFLPNLPALYGLADIRGYDPMRPAAHFRLTRVPLGGAGENLEHLARPGAALYDLLGVRYVLEPPKVRLGRPLVRVFRNYTGWIYERPRALPRLFLPAAAEEVAPGRWFDRLGKIADFDALTLVDRRGGASSPAGPKPWHATAPRGSTFEITLAGRDRFGARAGLLEPRLLATSLYQDGGWRLLVGGRPAPTFLTNGPFVGAWLPAGEERVDLLYRPPGFLAGCLLAACALALAVARWVPPPIPQPGRPSSGTMAP